MPYRVRSTTVVYRTVGRDSTEHWWIFCKRTAHRLQWIFFNHLQRIFFNHLQWIYSNHLTWIFNHLQWIMAEASLPSFTIKLQWTVATHIFWPYKLAYVVKIWFGCKLKVKTGFFECVDMMARALYRHWMYGHDGTRPAPYIGTVGGAGPAPSCPYIWKIQFSLSIYRFWQRRLISRVEINVWLKNINNEKH